MLAEITRETCGDNIIGNVRSLPSKGNNMVHRQLLRFDAAVSAPPFIGGKDGLPLIGGEGCKRSAHLGTTAGFLCDGLFRMFGILSAVIGTNLCPVSSTISTLIGKQLVFVIGKISAMFGENLFRMTGLISALASVPFPRMVVTISFTGCACLFFMGSLIRFLVCSLALMVFESHRKTAHFLLARCNTGESVAGGS